MEEDREARWRAWMVSAQSGDSVAYEKLLRDLIPYVRRFVGRRLFDTGATEDVVQEVLVSLHRARHTYRGERPFSPWLNAVVRNAVVDHIRARGRRSAREVSVAPERLPETAVEPEEPRNALSPELEEALSSLNAKQREAVTLVQIQGLSIAEAAGRAGVTQAALKVRAHRGYRALRIALDRMPSGEDPS